MGKGGYDPRKQIEDHEFRGAHHVFDVVAEDPKVQHIAEQVHPAAVQEHTRQHGRESGQRRDFRWKGRMAEQHGGNGSKLVHEDLAGVRRQ